jgi:NADH-quinone oxidoreductase subunit N
VLSSVVAAYYYLRIIKVMYFDNPVEGFDKMDDKSLKVVLYVSTALILFFIINPSPLIDLVQKSVSTLLAG